MTLVWINLADLFCACQETFGMSCPGDRADMSAVRCFVSESVTQRALCSFHITTDMMWYLFTAMAAAMGILYCYFRYRRVQARLQTLDAQNKMLENNYTQVNDFYHSNAKLYHDMHHHLKMVHHMLEEGEGEKAKQYIESLIDADASFSIRRRTKIDIIDVILCELERKAEIKGVSVFIETHILPVDLEIEKRDLCSMLANLTENALEAAQKEIRVVIKKVQRMLMVQVQNDCPAVPGKLRGRFLTHKQDKRNHGWGIRSVEDVVRRYQGSIEFRTREGIFGVDIMINI